MQISIVLVLELLLLQVIGNKETENLTKQSALPNIPRLGEGWSSSGWVCQEGGKDC